METRRNPGHAREIGRHGALAVDVGAPGDCGAITLQRDRVILACGNLGHMRKIGRHIALSLGVPAPRDDGPVVS